MPGTRWNHAPKTNMYCPECEMILPREAFTESQWRRSRVRDVCRGCISKSHAVRYVDGYAPVKKSKREYRLAVVNAIKVERGCRECGEHHPACLDFHHRDPMEKVLAVGVLVNRTTQIERILAEIEKCDVLCSNCHRKLHWRQKRPRRETEMTQSEIVSAVSS